MERNTGMKGVMPMGKSELEMYDELAGKLFSVFLLGNMLNIVISLVGAFRGIANYSTYIFGMGYVLFILIHKDELGKAWRMIFILEELFIILYVFSAILNRNYSADLLSRMYWTILYCIPLGTIWYYVNNQEVSIEYTRRAANISTICALLIFIIFLFDKSALTSPDYSMSLGYALLYPTLFHLKMIRSKRIYLLFSFLDIVILMCYGSRSQLLGIIIFVFLLNIYRNKPSSKKGFLFLTICTVAAITMILGFKQILQFIISFLGHFGIYSRSLGYFLERTTYSGREAVWAGAIKLIMSKPLSGWGIGINTTLVAGSAPHNVYLELLLQYGVILGGIISIFLTIIILKGTFGKTAPKSEGVLILFVTGFVPLLLSSSYLIWPQFWILIMICINRIKVRIQI